MDAIEFVYEQARMCRSSQSCGDCPIYTDLSCGLSNSRVCTKEQAQRVVQLVWDWAAEHPQETRLSKLLKQYPKAKAEIIKEYYSCPAYLGYSCPSPKVSCKDCWDILVDEEEQE